MPEWTVTHCRVPAPRPQTERIDVRCGEHWKGADVRLNCEERYYAPAVRMLVQRIKEIDAEATFVSSQDPPPNIGPSEMIDPTQLVLAMQGHMNA